MRLTRSSFRAAGFGIWALVGGVCLARTRIASAEDEGVTATDAVGWVPGSLVERNDAWFFEGGLKIH
jgi:hypothetical protein